MKKPDDKSFYSFEKLVDLMEERKIIIEDRDNAIYTLKNIPYYNLINNHKQTFAIYDENEDEYIDDYENTSFAEIRIVYDFERLLSSILYKYISVFEETLKSLIPHSISKEYGFLQSEYLDPDVYDKGRLKYDDKGNSYTDRDKLLAKLNERISSSYNQSIIHYKNEYHNVPPWILVNDCTFGELVNWLKLSNLNIKTEIVNHCFNKNNSKTDFNSLLFHCLYNINEFRNIVSHGGRIFHHKCKHELSPGLLKNYLQKYSISMRNNCIGQDGILSIVFSLICVFSNRDTVKNNFIDEIVSSFQQFNNNNNEIMSKLLDRCDIKMESISRLQEFKN
ncbi:Abi family protein [Enterococcus faecium]|uniref:Abi family protein n=1 Tax=Enterococcus faecium TaxID=1352 RepID=UPI002AF6A069|nr:Abi family protein [Enterococcus faecium]WQP88531.1 Abi family protein [Enterococcus faecium]